MGRKKAAKKKQQGLLSRAVHALFFGTEGQKRRAKEKAKEQEHFARELAKGEAHLRKERQVRARAAKAEEKKARREARQDALESARYARKLAQEEKGAALAKLAAEKARTKAARERERARKLDERADKARLQRVSAPARAKADTADRRADDLDSLAGRIEGGQYTPGELRDLMASGRLSIKRNPGKGKKGRRNPSLDAKARAESQEFHCEPDEVLKLSAKERQPLPAEVVDLGEIHSITYGPSKRSCRGKDLWRHAMGDRGDFVPPAKGRPHLVADPNTGRPGIAAENSPVKFDPKRGLIG